jgi:hypothetical protein
MGPRTEPCGTLQATEYSADALPEKWNVWWRSLRYERNQFNATLCTQKRLARTVRSGLWFKLEINSATLLTVILYGAGECSL